MKNFIFLSLLWHLFSTNIVFPANIEGIYKSISESEWELTVSLKSHGKAIIKEENWEAGDYYKREMKEIHGNWHTDEDGIIHITYNGISETLIYLDNLPADWQDEDDTAHPGIVRHPYYSSLNDANSVIHNTKLWKLPHRFYPEIKTEILPLIEKHFPGWTVLEYKSLDNKLKNFLDENMIENSPGWLISDFNGDNLYDLVILIYRKNKSAQNIEVKLVVFFSRQNFNYSDPIIITEKNLTADILTNTYLKILPAVAKIAKKSTNFVPKETREIIPGFPSIEIIHYPAHSLSIYYWDKINEKFKEITRE